MTPTPPTAETDPAADPHTAPRNRPLYLLVAGGVLSAAALTATLLTGNSSSNAAAPAPSAAAASSGADPLTTSVAPKTGDAKTPDNTKKARNSAARTLAGWSAGNPAAQGVHAVGGTSGSGPGGRIGEVLRIPALGRNWAQPVYDGVGDRQLRAGVGHFPETEQPGQIGNFALAGHRSGVADPAFRDIDRVKAGAAIQVTTAHRITYTYTVTRVSTVAPNDVNVIAQVPGQPDATPTKAKLTLVTCWPATGHSKRVVVEADLVSAKGGA